MLLKKSKWLCVVLLGTLSIEFLPKAHANKGFFNVMLSKRVATTLNLTIATENDDSELYMPDGNLGLFYSGENSVGDMYTGSWSSNYVYGINRFTLTQAIPAGATITNASMQVYGIGDSGWNSAGGGYLHIMVSDYADAPQVTTFQDGPGGTNNRAFSSTVRWPFAGNMFWTTSGLNTTVDLSVLIQFLVNKYGGLANGAHIQVWTYSDEPAVNKEVNYAGFSHASFATQLSITFQ